MLQRFHHELVIIGGGPAALQLALSATTEGVDSRCILQGTPGGQIVQSPRVENMAGLPKGGISGAEYICGILEACDNLGVKFIDSQSGATALQQGEDGWIEILTDCGVFLARAVVLAVGTTWTRHAMIEKVQYRHGIFYGPHKTSAIERGAYAVIGSANSAAQGILELADHAKVSMVHVLCRHTLECSWYLAERIRKNKKVKIHEHVECKDVDCMSSNDEYTLYLSDERQMQMSGVFVMAGQHPNTDWLAGSGIALNSEGYVIVDDHYMTNIPGVFAAGDCRTRVLRRSLTNAYGDAGNVFAYCWRYIRGEVLDHEPKIMCPTTEDALLNDMQQYLANGQMPT